jgi:uncharacterized membrane protein (DUF2068 family)
MRSSRWSGWVTFAGILMLVIGALDVFEGIIAIVRGQYYVLTANQIIVFDMRAWGWITLIWGVILGLAGFGLLTRHAWARWFAVVVASLNAFEQLAFVGSAQWPLWALTGIALSVVVIYALIVHWDEEAQPAV